MKLVIKAVTIFILMMVSTFAAYNAHAFHKRGAQSLTPAKKAYEMGRGVAIWLATKGSKQSCRDGLFDTAYERMIICIRYIDPEMNPNTWRYMAPSMEQGYLDYLEQRCKINCKDLEYTL